MTTKTIDADEVRGLFAADAPVSAPPTSWPFVFEQLTRKVRVHIVSLTDNDAWLNHIFTKAMRNAAAEEGAATEPGHPAIDDADYITKARAAVPDVARFRIVAWDVEDASGVLTPRDYTPELGEMFLLELLSKPRGLRQYLVFGNALSGPPDAKKTTPDPEATAGNSSAA